MHKHLVSLVSIAEYPLRTPCRCCGKIIRRGDCYHIDKHGGKSLITCHTCYAESTYGIDLKPGARYA